MNERKTKHEEGTIANAPLAGLKYDLSSIARGNTWEDSEAVQCEGCPEIMPAGSFHFCEDCEEEEFEQNKLEKEV